MILVSDRLRVDGLLRRKRIAGRVENPADNVRRARIRDDLARPGNDDIATGEDGYGRLVLAERKGGVGDFFCSGRRSVRIENLEPHRPVVKIGRGSA